MHPSSCLFALAFALLPLLPSRQDPAPPPKADEKPRWPWGNDTEAERIRAGFCGAWQLVRVDSGGQTFTGAQCTGFLLALPNYCSLDSYLVAPNVVDPRVPVPGFAAGTYKWEYDATRLMLIWSTLLHGTDMVGSDRQIIYERQGTRREYRVELTADEMTLHRGPDDRLSFRRVQVLVPPEPPSREPKKER
jgi:hypothetical protein